MGLFKNSFSTSGYRYPTVGNNFANISAKTKKFSNKFWGISQGPRYYRFMQKTRHQQSNACVPLKGLYHDSVLDPDSVWDPDLVWGHDLLSDPAFSSIQRPIKSLLELLAKYATGRQGCLYVRY